MLTIIIIFYNGRREAERSLYSLSTPYQKGVTNEQYEVLVLDSGSTEPLIASDVTKFGPNFRYEYVQTNHPSPTETLRYGLSQVKTDFVGIIIDGAHILSPGILKSYFEIQKINSQSFVYVPIHHLGNYQQNDSMTLGYNKEVEDKALAELNWRENGYSLFQFCCFDQSNFYEFRTQSESNCYFLPTKELRDIKTFDKDYFSIGGGLINLDTFQSLNESDSLVNYTLIGESTFHQFHGGTSTNIERENHPINLYRNEFKLLNGYNYRQSESPTIYYGAYHPSIQFVRPKTQRSALISLLKKRLLRKKPKTYKAIVDLGVETYPFEIIFLFRRAMYYIANNQLDLAEQDFIKATEIRKQTIPPLINLFDFYVENNQFRKAKEVIIKAIDVNSTDASLVLNRAFINQKLNKKQEAKTDLALAKKILPREKNINPKEYALIVKRLQELRVGNLALKYFNEGVLKFPDSLPLLITGFKLNSDEAFLSNIFKRIDQLVSPTDSPDIYFNGARAYQRIGSHPKAVEIFSKIKTPAKKLSKEIEKLKLSSLGQYETIDNINIAVNAYHQMNTSKIDHCYSSYILSLAHFRNNDLEKSIQYFIPSIAENALDATQLEFVNKLLDQPELNTISKDLLVKLTRQVLSSLTKKADLLSTAEFDLIKRLFSLVASPQMLNKLNQPIKTEDSNYDGFIFSHIQKTAGTSIRRYLSWAIRLSQIDPQLAHIPGEFGLGNHTNTIQLNEAELQQLSTNKVKIVLEHHSFHEVLPSYLSHLKNPFQYTILREPLSRFVSYYYFFYYNIDPVFNAHLNELSPELLEKFMRKCRNLQTAYLSGVDWHIDIDQKVGKPQLEKAKENLLNKFQCFGIFESLNESIKLLKSAAPEWLLIPEIDLPDLNKNKHQGIQVNDFVKTTFQKLNEHDIELYAFAKENFKKQSF